MKFSFLNFCTFRKPIDFPLLPLVERFVSYMWLFAYMRFPIIFINFLMMRKQKLLDGFCTLRSTDMAFLLFDGTSFILYNFSFSLTFKSLSSFLNFSFLKYKSLNLFTLKYFKKSTFHHFIQYLKVEIALQIQLY